MNLKFITNNCLTEVMHELTHQCAPRFYFLYFTVSNWVLSELFTLQNNTVHSEPFNAVGNTSSHCPYNCTQGVLGGGRGLLGGGGK